MAVEKAPQIALLGGGYTLQRVAKLLPSGAFVITSRSEETCAAWRSKGWRSHRLSLENPESVAAFFSLYPSIRTIVDGIPPVHAAADPAMGVKNICRSLKDRKDVRIIYLSTTGVFGVRDGSLVDESTPPSPWNKQGEARWLSEQAYRFSGLEVTALRLPAIYGPDRGMVASIRSGTYKLIGAGDYWTNRIHVDDLAMIIERAVAISSLPPVLCVSDDYPSPAREVVEFVCAREGCAIPRSITPDEALHAGAFTMLSNQRVKNSDMKRILGIQLQYPSFREGFYA